MVILVAVATRQIATTHGNDVRQHRVARGEQGSGDKTRLANFPFEKSASFHVSCGIDESGRLAQIETEE